MCTSMSVNINHRFRFIKQNVSWKSENDQAYRNANVPVNVFSGNGSGVFVERKAQPIKNTYRRSLNMSNSYISGSRGSTIKDTLDTPGGATASTINCDNVGLGAIVQHNGKTTNLSQTPTTLNQCISAERNARLRLRHKTRIPIAAGCDQKCTNKPYFTRLEERRKYLKQDFKSNQSNNVCCNRDPSCYHCSVSRRTR
jgi:hypothetical protein